MLLSICIFVLCITNIKAELEYDHRQQIRLEHVLTDAVNPEYQFRGDISLRGLHGGTASTDQIQLNSDELKQLKKLALKNENYRLKAVVTAADGKQTTFYTFTSACSMLKSSLQDILYLHLDHVGNIIGISLTTQLPCDGNDGFANSTGEFGTIVLLRSIEMGPVPDTASYIQKIERELEGKERGETKDNRSFLAKYWMYIVPVVIIVLISSANNPDDGRHA